MLRFSYFLKFFATIFFSQWVAFSANDYKGDVLVDRHKTGSPLRKPLSLTRSYSSPSVMTMGDNEELSYLSLAQAASKILDRDGDDVAVAAKKNSSFPPDVQEDRGAAERMDSIVFMARRLSDSARQPFTDSFALVILVILSQNYISTDSYISFMDSVPLKDRLTIAKALNIEGLKIATEKKVRDLEISVGRSCYFLLQEYMFNWRAPIQNSGRGHLGAAEGIMRVLDGDRAVLSMYFEKSSNIFLNSTKEIDELKLKQFKQELANAIADGQAKARELSVEEERLRKLKSFVPSDPMQYSYLACD